MSELASSQRGQRERLRSFYARWLAPALVATALVNLALTFFLPLSSQPLRPHAEGSLTYLVHTEQPSVNRRFAFYLELDDATDGGVLIVPVGSFVDSDLVRGLAGLEVEERDYDPTLVAGSVALPPSLGVVETDDGDLDYTIIPDDDDTWWLALTEGGVVVVPESVAPVPEVRS